MARDEAGPIALVTMDNGEDWQKPNVFGPEALQSLAARLEELEGADWAGMVLTGKPFVFCAGADIDRFYGVSAEEAREGRAGHELFGRIRALPFPTLAAINGACLGAASRSLCTATTERSRAQCGTSPARRSSSGSSRPGAARRSFRGSPAWTPLFASSSRIPSVRTGCSAPRRGLGLVDEVLHPAEFLDDSIAYLLDEQGPKRRPGQSSDAADGDLFAKARRQLDDSLHGAAPAPTWRST